MSGLTVVRASAADLDVWTEMRHKLWPHLAVDSHRAEIVDALSEPERLVAFLCLGLKGEATGFAEASVRSDYVNGCETSPVAFLEGIFVRSPVRRQGVARALVNAVAAWARSKGLKELASDADLSNTISHAMHEALGFEETQQVVYFRRCL